MRQDCKFKFALPRRPRQQHGKSKLHGTSTVPMDTLKVQQLAVPHTTHRVQPATKRDAEDEGEDERSGTVVVVAKNGRHADPGR